MRKSPPHAVTGSCSHPQAILPETTSPSIHCTRVHLQIPWSRMDWGSSPCFPQKHPSFTGKLAGGHPGLDSGECFVSIDGRDFFFLVASLHQDERGKSRPLAEHILTAHPFSQALEPWRDPGYCQMGLVVVNKRVKPDVLPSSCFTSMQGLGGGGYKNVTALDS